jgi:soluble lytic murein transglycosylase-like protein
VPAAILGGAAPATPTAASVGAASAAGAAVAALGVGSCLLDAGQAGDAVAWFEPAARPGSPVRDAALVLLGRAWLESGDPAQALACAEIAPESVERSVRRLEAALLGAEATAALGAWHDAARRLRDARGAWPAEARAARAAEREAEALEAAGEALEAAWAWRTLHLQDPVAAPADALDRARRLAEGAGVRLPRLRGRELLARADTLHDANLGARAADAYREAARAIGGASGTDHALHRLALVQFNLRDNDGCERTCAELQARFPRGTLAPAARLLQARLAWRLGQDERVLPLVDGMLGGSAHRRSDWRDELLRLRGAFLEEKARFDEAVASYDRLLAEHASSDLVEDVRWKAAWCRLLQGRAEDAASRFAALSKGLPRQHALAPAAAYWAAAAQQRAGHADEADRALAEVVVRWPYTLHGEQARRLLQGRWSGDALAALDAEAEASGVVAALPPVPDLDSPPGRRYVRLRDAGLHDLARGEIEAHRKVAPADDGLLLEVARARVRAGDAAGAQPLLQARFRDALEQPSRRTPRELWELVHPDPHRESLEHFARRHGVPPPLAAALIRAESWWDPAARSAADARGLMQLLPATADRLARDEGLAGLDASQLDVPEVSLALGIRHLGELLRRFGGDETAAVAAYNAGEERVASWWAAYDREGVSDPLERIDRIPYRETRPYVRRVLEASRWYAWLEGEPIAAGPT